MDLSRTVTAHLTRIRVSGTLVCGAFSGFGGARILELDDNTGAIITKHVADCTTPRFDYDSGTISRSITSLEFFGQCDFEGSSGALSGSMAWDTLEVWGDGPDPF
jgi:hypothetical protein